MKKLLLSLFVICFTAGAYAQSLDAGVKLGANFSKLNDMSSVKNKTGMVAGGFVSIGYNNMAIQPEVLYSQEGSKTDFGNFDLDYINVPVMFKYYLVGEFLNAQVGPQFGFLTKQSMKDQIKTKDFDFSGVAGLGLEIPFGLRVEARYNFGITNVTEDESAKKGVFSIAVGYSFL